MEIKTCKICNIEKPVAEFYPNSMGRPGYRSFCRKCNHAQGDQWRKRNPERAQEIDKRKRAKAKDKNALRMKVYAQNNRERLARISANYRAAKLKRTPKWADFNSIDKVYKECPRGMEVDHVVPLQGTIVSGLHVHYNLQYLTPTENVSKGNRFK